MERHLHLFVRVTLMFRPLLPIIEISLQQTYEHVNKALLLSGLTF